VCKGEKRDPGKKRVWKEERPERKRKREREEERLESGEQQRRESILPPIRTREEVPERRNHWLHLPCEKPASQSCSK